MNHLLIHQLYAAIAPWSALALLLLGRNPHPDLRRKIAAILLSALVLFVIPFSGWTIAAWLRVLEPNPSITLTVLLLLALTSRLTGQPLFRRQDWNAAWIFGAFAALVLYPMGLGLTGIDPYTWGWDPVLPLVATAAATLLLLRGNRFGIVLLLPFAGWLLGIQESTNFWNILVDPFYGAAALVVTAILVIRRCSPLTSQAAVID
jgi:hypothetical protein